MVFVQFCFWYENRYGTKTVLVRKPSWYENRFGTKTVELLIISNLLLNAQQDDFSFLACKQYWLENTCRWSTLRDRVLLTLTDMIENVLAYEEFIDALGYSISSCDGFCLPRKVVYVAVFQNSKVCYCSKRMKFLIYSKMTSSGSSNPKQEENSEEKSLPRR